MMKKMAYLSVVTSLIGASAISIDLGNFQLSIFRIIIILMLFGLIVNLFKKNGIININRMKSNSYSIWFMCIWLTYAILTLAWAKDYISWGRAVYFLGLGVFCVIMYNKIFKSSDDILVTFRIISIMTVIHNVIGWYELTTGNYLFLAKEIAALYTHGNYPVSIFSNTNDFATFMLISTFVNYICLANSRRLLMRIIHISLIISSIYLLIMTGSRANILGLFIAFAVFAYFSFQNRRGRIIIFAFCAVAFTFLLFMPNVINDFLLYINDALYFKFSAQMGSDSIRINLIKNGLLFLINTFGFGTGAGNIEYWMSNYAVYSTENFVNIHNWWMEILVSYGVIIFILYLAFYVTLFRSQLKIYRYSKDKIESIIALGLMCCMVGFAIGGMSSSSNISSEWLWVFWGIAIAFQGMNNKILKER